MRTDGGQNEISEVCIALGTCCTNNDIYCVSLTLEADCTAYGGTWLGEGTSCDDCPPPVEPEVLGACCVNGTCVRTTFDDCFAGGGSYAGDDIDCDEAQCPETCQGDVNDDGNVDVVDLLTVIANWNDCP